MISCPRPRLTSAWHSACSARARSTPPLEILIEQYCSERNQNPPIHAHRRGMMACEVKAMPHALDKSVLRICQGKVEMDPSLAK